MTKRSFFLLGFLFGLIIGSTIIYIRATTRLRHYRDIFDLYQAAEYALAAQDASHAYYEESRPVAIYALSQQVLKLEQEEKDDRNPFVSDKDVPMGMVITHGRLAKLYAEAGETNLEAQNVAQALIWGKKTNRWHFTNEMQLTNWIAKGNRSEEHLNKQNTDMAPR